MSKIWLIIIAVAIFIILITTFIVTFILFRKTPEPKGCQPSIDQCKSCSIKGCRANIYLYQNKNIDSSLNKDESKIDTNESKNDSLDNSSEIIDTSKQH